MVTIDNNVLIGLSANTSLVTEFPFLMQARHVKSGCCGNSTSLPGNTNVVKMQIANLPANSKERFKLLTGWNRIRVVYESGASTQTVIF